MKQALYNLSGYVMSQPPPNFDENDLVTEAGRRGPDWATIWPLVGVGIAIFTISIALAGLFGFIHVGIGAARAAAGAGSAQGMAAGAGEAKRGAGIFVAVLIFGTIALVISSILAAF